MSEEQLNAFLEKVKSDNSLQEKLNGAADADAVVAIAKDAGFTITVEDIQSTRNSSEVSDVELENAAGGYGRCFDHRVAVIVNTGTVCIKPTPSIKRLPLC